MKAQPFNATLVPETAQRLMWRCQMLQMSMAWAHWAVLSPTCGGFFGQICASVKPSARHGQLQNRMMENSGTTTEESVYYFNLLFSG